MRSSEREGEGGGKATLGVGGEAWMGHELVHNAASTHHGHLVAEMQHDVQRPGLLQLVHGGKVVLCSTCCDGFRQLRECFEASLVTNGGLSDFLAQGCNLCESGLSSFILLELLLLDSTSLNLMDAGKELSSGLLHGSSSTGVLSACRHGHILVSEKWFPPGGVEPRVVLIVVCVS